MKLKVSHIAKSFGEYQVLSDMSLEVSEGRASVLMGANGSGKTTLFNIISGYSGQDSGVVFVNNTEISNLKPYQRKLLGIGRTFQDMRLIGNLSVKENVMLSFPCQEGEKWWKTLLPNKAIKSEQLENAQRTEAILTDCFIQEIADSKASDISYGQQKLLNLACCIASDASILLLDEPVAGVNPVFRDKLSLVIQNLKDQGKSILIIEHNADFIEKVADEILFLYNGKIQQFDSYQEFKNAPEVIDAYI